MLRNLRLTNYKKLLTHYHHHHHHDKIKLNPSNRIAYFSSIPTIQDKSNQSSSSSLNSINENVKDISKTAKQEVGKTMESVLESMSGSSKSNSHHDDQFDQLERHNSRDSKFSKTEMISDMKSFGGIFHSVPRGALIFGGAGLVPYLATSITTIYLARQVYRSEHGSVGKFDSETALTLLYHNENLQVAYGAVILSFLGAIHWGIEFAAEGSKSTPQLEPKGAPRYLLGTLPVLLAWPTLLLPGQLALASQWAAFVVVWYTDMIATGKGWTPKWYSTYRFGLTAIVGSSILITLGSTNYWAIDDTGYSSTSRKLQAIRERENIQNAKDRQDGGTGGIKIEGSLSDDSQVGSVSGEDSFVVLKDLKKPDESKSKDN